MNAPAILFTDGKAYERLMGRWSQIAGAKFLDWLDPPRSLNWIDVGCGNGAFTEVLIARTAPAAVTGIDPSDGQISYARTRPAAKLAQFRVADAHALPFADNNFDAASMALVITFLSDPGKAVREMARVVKPGGLVASYMWDFPGGGFPIRPLGAAMKSLGLSEPARPNVEASRRETMEAFWREAGLLAVETTVIRIRVSFADFDDFWESSTVPVGPSGKTLAEMSPATREQLKAELRKQLPIAADGSIAYEAFANAVKGRVPA
ncbi:MAG TPA: class I SAM-dependent methyltransferase [Xanthobacteraceae bacterium]|nr:class I SAM-dependent methyltransferase [Xanthobacteraceae bacterium]